MKRSWSVGLSLLCACSCGLPGSEGAAPAQDRIFAVASPSGVVLEDALEAFFGALDRKSTTLAAFSSEPAAEVPPFPNRDALHARMMARLASVDRLRAQGLAGENKRGFLEPRGRPSNADQGIISEENTDRLALYEAIATQTKSKVDVAARARAEKIGLMARRGVWVQDVSDQWAQKT